jgi:poly(3-hydroxybutyrate) depolymerase
VGLSQSGPATLVLAAMLARDMPELRPASVTFLGCQLDPREAPTPLQQVLAPWPRDLLTGSLTTAVAASYPGAGRRVYPSLLQLLAYGMASPHLYADVQHGLLRELATGGAGAYDRQHTDMHSLLDVPAELFLQMLEWVLGPAPWSDGAPVLAGERFELESLRRMPVLTVEAAEDELVGRGQTHGLGGRLPWLQPAAVTVPGGRHHDLFTGPGFTGRVAPELRRFYAALDR